MSRNFSKLTISSWWLKKSLPLLWHSMKVTLKCSILLLTLEKLTALSFTRFCRNFLASTGLSSQFSKTSSKWKDMKESWKSISKISMDICTRTTSRSKFSTSSNFRSLSASPTPLTIWVCSKRFLTPCKRQLSDSFHC